MRRLFISLLVLLAAVVLALYAQQDPGYVVVQFRGWTIEASLVLTAAALIVGFVLLYVGARFVLTGLRLPSTMRDWRNRRRQRLALANLERGFADLMEGRWERAEKRLARGIVPGASGMVNYLGAARAAQELGAIDRRDGYLRAAGAGTPTAETGLALAQAEMQLGRAQYAQASATLERLHGMAPRNRLVLTQLMRLRLQIGDWERLLEMVPALRRQGIIDDKKADGIELRAAAGMLESPVLQDESDLGAAWSRLPKALRDREELLRCYVRRLLECGAPDRAEAVLRGAIDRQWRPSLVYLYGLIEGGTDPDRRLRHAETWLRRHPGDAVLLLSLGRICRRGALPDKARSYLESSLQQADAVPEACNELALVLDEAGDREAALAYYRRAAVAAAESEVRALAGDAGAKLLPQSS